MMPIRNTCGVSRKNGDWLLHSSRKKDTFTKHIRYSSEFIQWLDHFRNENIAHAENSTHGKVRIGDYSVDGFDATTNTVYEYYGCFHQGHSSNENHDGKKCKKTLQREAELRGLGYNIVSTTSCEWFVTEESKIWYHPTAAEPSCRMEDIIDGVKSEELLDLLRTY